MLGRGTVKFARDRRGNLHSYWLDRDGKAREFYTKGASAWPIWRRAFRMGEIRRCPSYDLDSPRHQAIKEKKSMKSFKRIHDPRKVFIIVNGYPRSGKDTFVDMAGKYFAKLGWGAHAMSSIDPVIEILDRAGISAEPKTPEKRALMAEIKSALEKHDRFVSRTVVSRMDGAIFQSSFMMQIGFIHVREPDAIAFMKTLVSGEFFTVFVDRPDAERVTSNAADMGVEGYSYDFTIQNDRDLAALQKRVHLFVHEIIAAKGAEQ